MANAYVAGASNLPFAVLRGYTGSDFARVNDRIRSITCPFTGEVLAATPAIRPDVTVIHAQKADWKGNVLLWGILGVQKEADSAYYEAFSQSYTPLTHLVVRTSGDASAVAEGLRRAIQSIVSFWRSWRRKDSSQSLWPTSAPCCGASITT